MSTKKKTEVKKVEKNIGTIKLSDGSEVKAEGAFVINKDGTYERCRAEDMLSAKTAAMTITSVNRNTGEISEEVTYGVSWKKINNGYSFRIATANGLVDEKRKLDGVEKEITLLGRGDAVKASFALKQVWFAFASQFGIQDAFRMVKVILDYQAKDWTTLLVPVTDVIG